MAPVFLKAGPWDWQYQNHLGICWRCIFSGPTPDLLKLWGWDILWVQKAPQVILMLIQVWQALAYIMIFLISLTAGSPSICLLGLHLGHSWRHPPSGNRGSHPLLKGQQRVGSNATCSASLPTPWLIPYNSVSRCPSLSLSSYSYLPSLSVITKFFRVLVLQAAGIQKISLCAWSQTWAHHLQVCGLRKLVKCGAGVKYWAGSPKRITKHRFSEPLLAPLPFS